MVKKSGSKKGRGGLKEAMAASIKAYEKGSKTWFNFLAKDATVYAIPESEPFRGRGAYEEAFARALTSSKRKLKVLKQNIQDLGDNAIVTQTIQITQDKVVANLRQSVVWTFAAGNWQIKHLHTALIGTPSSTVMPTSSRAVGVINERIATVAATLGVAQ